MIDGMENKSRNFESDSPLKPKRILWIEIECLFVSSGKLKRTNKGAEKQN